MTASAPRPPLIPFVPRDFLIAPVFTATPQTEPRTLTINNVKWAIGGCTPKPSKIPSKWISDFHSLVQPSFADIGSIFTATIPFVAEELRSISMRCWQTWCQTQCQTQSYLRIGQRYLRMTQNPL